MTTPDERFQEFIDQCVHEADDGQGATRIDGEPDRQREARRYRHQAEYHALAARDNLEGRAPLMAIREGYYVMMHKANEALALAGFKPRTHVCTLLGLRGVFDAPELADMLRRASLERQNVDYYINPEHPELAEFAGPEEFVEEIMEEFVRRVDSLLKAEGLLGDENGGPSHPLAREGRSFHREVRPSHIPDKSARTAKGMTAVSSVAMVGGNLPWRYVSK